MVLVLIVALTALGFLGRYFKRRHARKVAERRAAASGIPRSNGTPDIGHGREMWGPHQHMAHTGGFEYTTEQHRQMRDASATGGLEKTKSTKSDTKRSLRKKSRHESQRKGDTETTRAEGDENARKAAADIRRPRSQKRKEGTGDGELKGLDETKDKQRADTGWRYDKEGMI